MKYNRFGFILTFLLLLGIGIRSVEAGILRPWAPPMKIPDYEILSRRGPYTVADHNRTVHAFNSQHLPDGSGVIVYRQWTQKRGWTIPTDIYWEPIKDLELLDIFLDTSYTIHIIFAMEGNLYYSKSYLQNAAHAPSWSSPILIGSKLSTTYYGYSGAIIGNNEGKLVITYGGLEQGSGLYVVYSESNGIAWADPINISPAYNSYDRMVDIRLVYGESGLIHAVWAYSGDSGFGTEGFYSNLDINTKVWVSPLLLDDTPGIEHPSVVEHNGKIILTYYHWNANCHWYRYSSDYGGSWSNPIRISNRHTGNNGDISFAVDGDQTLHLFFPERTTENIHGVWHSIWNNGKWVSQTSVIQGPRIRDVIGGEAFDPHSVNAIIVNGNVVLVTWVTDGGAGANGGWYSFTTLDSSEITMERIPTQKPKIQLTPFPKITITSTEQPVLYDKQLIDDISGKDKWNWNNSFSAIYISTILVIVGLILITSVVIFKNNHRS